MKKIFSSFLVVIGLLLIFHYASAATPGLYMIGDGSGGGGGAGIGWGSVGGTGGTGGGGADTLDGGAGDDVIFGDGSGGGSTVGGGNGGTGGGGADTLDGGAGDDVIFGDGFNGFSCVGWCDNRGGLGGGGGGGGFGYWGSGPGGGGGGIGAGGGGGAGIGGSGGTTVVSGIGSSGGDSGGNGGASATDVDEHTGAGGANYISRSGGGGGGFGGAAGGAAGDVTGVSGGNGDTNQHVYSDGTGAIKAYFTLSVLRSLLTSYPNYGAGNDIIDGGAGTNDLFGLGGNNTFAVDSVNSATLNRIWDFKIGDVLKLKTSSTEISQAAANAVIAGATIADYDGDGSSDDVALTFSGSPIQIMNNSSMIFSAASNGDITVASGTPQTLTYIAGTGGSLTGSTTQIINYGLNGSAVTAVASSGYHFVNWSDASTTNPRIDYHITTTTSLTANFALNISFGNAITLDSNSHVTGYKAYSLGTIEGAGNYAMVGEGTSTSLTVVRSLNTTPNNEYQLQLGKETNNFYATAIGDLDGDGDLDLVTAGPNGNPNNVYYWDSTNHKYVKTATTPARTFYGTNLLIGDFTGDGKKDVLWFLSNDAYLGTNNSTTTDYISFSSVTDTHLAISNNAFGNFGVASGDFNGDGSLDFVNCGDAYNGGNYGGYYQVGINDGTGNFTLTTPAVASDHFRPQAVAVGDFNKDGKDDFVVERSEFSPAYGAQVIIYTRDSANTGFSTTTLETSASTYFRGVAVADVNGDTYPDIIVQSDSGSSIEVHLNRGDGTFPTTPDATIYPGNKDQYFLVDINNDGKEDILTTTSNLITYYPQAETTPPTVSLTLPSASEATSSTMTLAATAADNTAIAGVKFYINNVLIGSEDTTSPYSVTYNTAATTTGAHTAFAVARDVFNNYATSSVISFSIVPSTLALTYSAGAGGTITGSSSQMVSYNGNGLAATATPSTGYHFVDWSDASTTNPRIDYNITTTTTLTANFATSTYALIYTAGTGGTLSGSSSQIINYGSNGTAVTASPETGYHFVDWSDASTTNPRTDYNISGTTTIAANFSINTFTLSYTAGTGGSITGSASQTIDYNANGTAVTAVPVGGYAFLRWSDGSTANPRTDSNITANLSVTASFYSLGNSAITPAPSVGAGVVDVAIPMNEQRAISDIKPNGTNVLAYVGSTGGFNITVSQTKSITEHHLKILSVDMINKKITVEITSDPKTIELGVGEEKKIDLDNDNISDMSLTFNELLNNRVDLTINQLAFNDVKKAAEKPAVVVIVKKSATYKFTRDLKYGMSGADVKELQKYLNANGFTVAKSGIGSSGKETAQFGPATKNALIKFQKAKKITPAVGYFGVKTRAAIK